VLLCDFHVLLLLMLERRVSYVGGWYVLHERVVVLILRKTICYVGKCMHEYYWNNDNGQVQVHWYLILEAF